MSRTAAGLRSPVNRKRGNFMNSLQHHSVIYLFLLPTIALFLLFSAYPIVYSFFMSFTNWKITGSSHFVGFKNYIDVLTDPVLLTSIKNVLLYTVISVPIQMFLGLIVAMGLDRAMPGRPLLRLFYYLPVITSWIVVIFLFQYLFETQFGLVNWLLESLHIIQQPIPWLAEPTKAVILAAIIQIWKGIGWAMMIYLAGLQNIPDDLYEAASIDGAGTRKRFLFITLPGLSGPTFFNSVVLVIGAIQSFLQIFILTAGGPADESTFPTVLMYEKGFSELHFGYASALSWLMALLIIIITVIQFSIFRPRSMRL